MDLQYVYDLFKDLMDVIGLEFDYEEREGDDLRLDFYPEGDYSVWIRNDGSIDGALPKRFQQPFSKWAYSNKIIARVDFT